jgi:hypothetical protein
LATAGTYASAPNFIQSFGPGARKPCEPVGYSPPTFNTTADTATSSTTFAVNTNQEISYTPASAANLLMIEMSGNGQTSTTNIGDVGISRGTTSNTNMLGNFGSIFSNSASVLGYVALKVMDYPNTASAVTYAGQRRTTSGTFGFPMNGGGSSTNKAMMLITEIMG